MGERDRGRDDVGCLGGVGTGTGLEKRKNLTPPCLLKGLFRVWEGGLGQSRPVPNPPRFHPSDP